MSNFHLQGAVPLTSQAYVERSFELLTLQNILSSNWVLLLGPGQHGKTSGLIRVKSKLHEAGLACVIVDLQSMPPCQSFEEVIEWFAYRVAQVLNITIPQKPAGHDLRHLSAWLDVAIPLGQEPIVVVIDEASAISNDEWRNSFYGQIRAIANERATVHPGALAARLRFVFAGSFRPETLVNNLNSPFNVCTRVETDDLLLESAIHLNQQVTGDQDDTFVRQAYELVGGHPYLLQFLLSRIQSAVDQNKQVAFDDAVKSLRDGQDDHFGGVFSRILAEAELTRLVSLMVSAGGIPNEPANPDYRYLQILGVAKREGTRLVFRNQLYQEFARSSSQLTRDASTVPNPFPLIIPAQDAYSFVRSNKLREFAYSIEVGAVRAYNSGSYRLALAGFGSALEAVLIDWLSNLPSTSLTSAIAAASPTFNNHETRDQPATWRFVNLIKVAKRVNNTISIVDPPDALREWRNLIHPAVAQQNYLPEDQLEPEARAASGLLASVRRDVARVV